ncbi:hypothetical protein JOQ06_015838 [Pogonophryne albipinna]|uniref:Uncharacterized protein n=1 Tax=Pogonophryne albipinna TaxID=1090488 RepID=A0AAD6AM63_9TELE|nr:hypothetical protein JOQ06_015838 [Pogonophryne albipinna]
MHSGVGQSAEGLCFCLPRWQTSSKDSQEDGAASACVTIRGVGVQQEGTIRSSFLLQYRDLKREQVLIMTIGWGEFELKKDMS